MKKQIEAVDALSDTELMCTLTGLGNISIDLFGQCSYNYMSFLVLRLRIIGRQWGEETRIKLQELVLLLSSSAWKGSDSQISQSNYTLMRTTHLGDCLDTTNLQNETVLGSVGAERRAEGKICLS